MKAFISRWVVLMGNPTDGFVVVGPFTFRESAIDYMETDPSYGQEPMWVVESHQPAPWADDEDLPDEVTP
jgi:hypothetical protein